MWERRKDRQSEEDCNHQEYCSGQVLTADPF
jgi:hypothetical protein